MDNYNQPRVVVFGGAGYIGSVLIRRLLEENFQVRVVVHYLFGQSGIENLSDPRLQLIEGDLCDIYAVSAAVKGAESIVMLASLVGRRVEDISCSNMREVNFLGATVVLDAAVEHGVNRFIFASTDSVYGTQSGVMYETGTPAPASLYSRLKLRMEERIINAKRRDFHPSALRISTCHGVSPRMRFDLVLNGLVRDAVCRQEIHLAGGEQCRSLVHVEDVTSAILACLQAHPNLISGEVFNVGSKDQDVELQQLANIVKSILPETQVHFHEGEPDLVDYHLSCSKIEKILDFAPAWSIEDSVQQMRSALLENTWHNPYSMQYQNT